MARHLLEPPKTCTKSRNAGQNCPEVGRHFPNMFEPAHVPKLPGNAPHLAKIANMIRCPFNFRPIPQQYSTPALSAGAVLGGKTANMAVQKHPIRLRNQSRATSNDSLEHPLVSLGDKNIINSNHTHNTADGERMRKKSMPRTRTTNNKNDDDNNTTNKQQHQHR